MLCNKCRNMRFLHRSGHSPQGVPYYSYELYEDHHESLQALKECGTFCHLCYKLLNGFEEAYHTYEQQHVNYKPWIVFVNSSRSPVVIAVQPSNHDPEEHASGHVMDPIVKDYTMHFRCGSLEISPRIADNISGSIKEIIDTYAISTSPNSVMRVPSDPIMSLVTDVDLATAWIRNCLENHPPCQEANIKVQLPYRVLDVSHPRVVKLVAGAKRRARYITLSYMWGTGEKYLLTSKSKAQLQAGIYTEHLPLTFMQAAEFTRRIGVNYLWIDALCIQQDSPMELEEQIAQMDNVFRGSLLTLFASEGMDAFSGLRAPQQRDIRLPIKVIVTIQENLNFVEREFYLQDFATDGSWQASVPLHRLPLFRRGWVFQEEAMSHRALIFTAGETFWRCLCAIHSEGIPACTKEIESMSWRGDVLSSFRMDVLRRDATIVPTKHHGDHDNLMDIWYEVVENYSCRHLTFLSDILPGLAGLASIFSKLRDYTYLAGLWAEDIQMGLSWHSSIQRAYEPHQEVARKSNLPSWSWVAQFGTGKTILFSEHHGLYRRVKHCGLQLIHTNITKTVSHGSAFGGISHGILSVRAFVKWAEIDYHESTKVFWPVYDLKAKPSGLPRKVAEFIGDHQGIASLHTTKLRILCVLCAVGYSEDNRKGQGVISKATALGVVPVLEQPGVYKRVGLVVFHRTGWFGNLEGGNLNLSKGVTLASLNLA